MWISNQTFLPSRAARRHPLRTQIKCNQYNYIGVQPVLHLFVDFGWLLPVIVFLVQHESITYYVPCDCGYILTWSVALLPGSVYSHLILVFFSSLQIVFAFWSSNAPFLFSFWRLRLSSHFAYSDSLFRVARKTRKEEDEEEDAWWYPYINIHGYPQQLLLFTLTYWNKDHIFTANKKYAAPLQQQVCVYTYWVVFTASLVQLCVSVRLCVA